jgi:glycosyltransferase involved in cell wall biosynthesis
MPNSQKQIRIAMLLPGLGRVNRGAEAAFIALGRALVRQKNFDVTMIGSGTDYPNELNFIVVPCTPRERFERWPKAPIFRSEYCYEEFSFITQLMLQRDVHLKHYDAVIHCTFPFTNWYVNRLRRFGVQSVFVTQNGDWMCKAHSMEYRTFRCDGLVCTNPSYFQGHSTQYPSALIPNGVDPERFLVKESDPSTVRDPRVPSGGKVIFLASALIASKRVDVALRAAARQPETFMVIAGDGPERAALIQLASTILPHRHLFLGSIRPTEMPKWYRQADLFMHLSMDEPFGLVYLEAAASGLPILAHRTPVTEWILGDTALLIDSNNPDQLDMAMTSLFDESTSQRFGRLAQQRVLKDWTWDRQAMQYRHFIDKLCKKNQKVCLQ